MARDSRAEWNARQKGLKGERPGVLERSLLPDEVTNAMEEGYFEHLKIEKLNAARSSGTTGAPISREEYEERAENERLAEVSRGNEKHTLGSFLGTFFLLCIVFEIVGAVLMIIAGMVTGAGPSRLFPWMWVSFKVAPVVAAITTVIVHLL